MSPVVPGGAGIRLFWIPLGAGAHVVRLSGRIYEGLAATAQRRSRCDLYHSALEIAVPPARFVVEMTPVPDGAGPSRGVVAEGPVGSRLLGRFRLFRYEVRRWPGGVIPDVDAAAATLHLPCPRDRAERLLGLLPAIPTLVWGRDELGAGDMWNSNSVTAWLLARGGLDLDGIGPPPGGRAPGWHAGLVAAAGVAATDAGRKAA
jgi:hypothetical protein